MFSLVLYVLTGFLLKAFGIPTAHEICPVENVGEIRPLLGQVTIQQRAVTYQSDDGTVAVQIAQELSLPEHFRLHWTTRLK